MTITFTANDNSTAVIPGVSDLVIDTVNKLAIITIDIANYPKVESK